MPVTKKAQHKLLNHRLFGIGYLFGQRDIAVGAVLDVYFPADERTRTILAAPEYWTEPPVEPPLVVKSKLRTAFSQYKKLHAPPRDESCLPDRLEKPSFEDELIAISA